MNIAQIENNTKALVEHLVSGELATNDFIYELLLAYGHRNSTISMLKTGHYNIAKEPNEIIFKRHLYFKQIKGEGLHTEIDRMKSEKLVIANRTRFVIVTNFHTLLAVDTKTGDSLDIDLTELPKKFDFFLPWAGMEKAVYQGESPADVKAAEKMAKLFDLIKADNFTEETLGDKAALHNLNVFLTRLLFCFFAEDTEIFAENQFSNAIQAHTNEDGSDLAEYLNRLFSALNTAENERCVMPEYLANFPYVNGGLFADNISTPNFTRKSRRMLIECGSELNWSDINPDIFGSMFQSVVHPEKRGDMGMHYTSVSNIMKVIEPLFLNELYDELIKVGESATKLQKLQQRLGELKVFDPACGSGNFLIIAYKEIRRLEMELLKRWQQVELEKTGQIFQPFSVIKLSQFHGIELDDFAHEIAILSIWLAEHQMNLEFKEEFGEILPSLPLKKTVGIIQGNATRIDWSTICDFSNDEVYILGNPPYQGAKKQNKEQKEDMALVFAGSKTYKNLDYIACWFYLACQNMGPLSKVAFVTTNSLIQGDQVSLLWQHISLESISIIFGYETFKWGNNAKGVAGVSCVILGLAKCSVNERFIYTSDRRVKVKNISPYLTEGDNLIVHKRKRPISNLPEMIYGNMPLEGGFLKLEINEFESLNENLEIRKFIRPLAGGNEFLKGEKRWCLWIDDQDLTEALKIPEIKSRIENVRKFRESAGEVARTLVERSHQFRYRHVAKNNFLLIPCTSSERREYLQVGVYASNYISMNSAQVVIDPPIYLFGVLSSKMHMLWAKATAGCLESRLRYSNIICYNNFPIPDLTSENIESITTASLNILDVREHYLNKKIGELYDPDKMPPDLIQAHKLLDDIVEKIYRDLPFSDDTERLSTMFSLYKKMTGGQSA